MLTSKNNPSYIAYFIFACYSLKYCDYNAYGTIQFHLKDQFELYKTGNVWNLTVSVNNKHIFKLLNDPNNKYLLCMKSLVYIDPSDPLCSRIQTNVYPIQVLLENEFNSLLIEMKPIYRNLKADEDSLLVPLILNVNYNKKSNSLINFPTHTSNDNINLIKNSFKKFKF